MKRTDLGSITVYNLSARDTYDWANRPGESWKCSTLADRRVRIETDTRTGDIVGLTVDGRDDDGNIDATELEAIIADHWPR